MKERKGKNMEEKKNANQAPELRDEELDQVAGGYSYNGPELQCSQCSRWFYPENEEQETNKICPKCCNHRGFAKVEH